MVVKEKDSKIEETKWVRKKEYMTHLLDDELVILDEESKVIHVLNKVGTEIYNLLDGKRSFEDIISYLMVRYEVDEETLRKDVATIIEKLEHLGIISELNK